MLSDDFDEMEQQALRIASWGENVYVKIPITNTRGRQLRAADRPPGAAGREGQRHRAHDARPGGRGRSEPAHGPPSCISIFAGRIADTGCDPLPILCGALARIRAYPQIELIWASPRELFNIVQADEIGCHIITVTHDLLKKLPLLGRDLTSIRSIPSRCSSTTRAPAGFHSKYRSKLHRGLSENPGRIISRVQTGSGSIRSHSRQPEEIHESRHE